MLLIALIFLTLVSYTLTSRFFTVGILLYVLTRYVLYNSFDHRTGTLVSVIGLLGSLVVSTILYRSNYSNQHYAGFLLAFLSIGLLLINKDQHL